MTEEQIERCVERMVDRLDRRYIEGEMTHDEYLEAMRHLSLWADKAAQEAA